MRFSPDVTARRWRDRAIGILGLEPVEILAGRHRPALVGLGLLGTGVDPVEILAGRHRPALDLP